jgi:hypothetical protein
MWIVAAGDRRRVEMFKRVVRAVCLAAIVPLLTSGVALADAGGQGTVTITQHASNVVLFSAPLPNPCTGAPGTVTAVAANEVFHVTFFTTGPEFWFTSTAEGTATFTPTHPSDASASGHFTLWFGESFNNTNDVQHSTSTFNLIGSDGSHVVIHETFHWSINANGVVTVNFDKINVTCG